VAKAAGSDLKTILRLEWAALVWKWTVSHRTHDACHATLSRDRHSFVIL